MVAGLGDLDDRRHPAQRLVHGLADVGGHEAVLGPQQRQPATHLGQVGQGAGPDAAGVGELGEDPQSNFHCQPPLGRLADRRATWSIT